MVAVTDAGRSVDPAAVLAELPAWKNATIQALGGGLTNSTWLVEADGRRAVLKIDDEPRGLPFNTRSQEAQIQTVAFENGLANPVLNVADRVYMTEYVDGVVWSIDCLDDTANLEKLAVALKKLHALPLTGRTFDVRGAARYYAKHIGDGDSVKIGECLAEVEAGPRPLNLCCCHNDLVVANIINTPEVRFLDWEYACDNDPFFDLATVVAHHQLSSPQSDYLLDVYFDGDGDRWREQLARQARVYKALLWLWETARLPAVA